MSLDAADVRSRLADLLREILTRLECSIKDAVADPPENLHWGFVDLKTVQTAVEYLRQLGLFPDGARLKADSNALVDAAVGITLTDWAREEPELADWRTERFGPYPAPLDDDQEHERLQGEHRFAQIGHVSRLADFVRGVLQHVERDLREKGEDKSAAEQDEPTRAAVGATDTETWPPDEGWHFEPGRAAFRGVVFAISGKEHKLLQELARARRAHDCYELGEAISPESAVGAGTVRGYLSNIRKILRVAFCLSKEQDPILRFDSDPSAYQLNSDLLRPR